MAKNYSSILQRNSMGFSLAIALAATSFASGAALAQEAPQASVDDSEQGVITVTARRKSEDILKTPISISALTAEDIAAKGTTTIQDIAQAVPGLNVQSVATQGQRADRSFTSIQLRGFVPSTSAAQTTSIFIDGAPVSVATATQALTNPERVEIIKGPQSALFGRQTFAGALNIVTKKPSDELTGSVMLSAGTRANYDIQAEFSAPIIKDVLSFRASVRGMGKHGSYRNHFIPNQTLGDQSTKTASLAIEFTPTSNLTIKAFGLATELSDGPAATALIAAKDSPAGQNLVLGQSNCNVTSANGISYPFFCGVAPGLSPLAPSANTANTAAIVTYLNLKNGDRIGAAGTVGRLLDPSEGVKGYGLVNHFRHYHVSIDWELGDSGVTLSSLTAINREVKSELADLDNYYSVSVVGTPTLAGTPQFPLEGFYNFPFMIEAKSRDFSQELRASFENGGPLHASFGGSYLFQRNQSNSGSPYLNSLTFGGPAESKTLGIFGSIGYDFSDKFTLSADARYQIDKVSAFAGQGGINNALTKIPELGLIVQNTYKNFLPRVIAQFNFADRNMAYASYSKGVNPGQFNVLFVTSAEPLVRERAIALGYGVVVDPEKITNYEIGVKGRAGILRYDAAAFLAMWDNQIQSQQINFPSDGRGPSAAGAPIGFSAAVNSGKVKVTGLEASLSADIAPGLVLDVAGAYVKTFIITASNVPVASFYNITNFRGKENPFVSKYSANVALAYTAPLSDDVDAFGRVDFTYKSGGWADISNTVRAPDLTQVNLRAGVRNKSLSFEVYATNLFNNAAFYSVGPAAALINGQTGVSPTYSALIGQPRDLRTIGVRAGFNF